MTQSIYQKLVSASVTVQEHGEKGLGIRGKFPRQDEGRERRAIGAAKSERFHHGTAYEKSKVDQGATELLRETQGSIY